MDESHHEHGAGLGYLVSLENHTPNVNIITKSKGLHYGIALLSVGISLLLTQILQPLKEGSMYSLSLAAVIITAWFGGFGPGLFATALAGLGLDYFFIGSPHLLEFDIHHLGQVGVFMAVASVIGYLTVVRRRAEAELRDAHDKLELRVRERTRELGQVNRNLQNEIIERKEAEAKVARFAHQLEERNTELLRLQAEFGRVERLAALGRLTGTIAHELGTPLNSVLGYAQLLKQENLPDGAHRRLDIIKEQVERMVDVINQHLSRARGSFQNRADVNINELAKETLAMLMPIFQQHEITVDTRWTESLPHFQGDEGSLRRVLINLLDNAVDAMSPGGTLTVTTAISSPPESRQPSVVIEITDTGSGIAPGLLPKIFEFFVTTKAPGHGTGLGLAVCQEIVKGHGGTIDVSSRLGKGTRVRVYLPLEQIATGN